jgi:Ala-tRNA(Pro) deacylase
MAIPTSIQDFLKTRGVPFSTLTHRTAFTAQEEAAVTHVRGREWAKTVVCIADGNPILAVLPAHFSVDLDRLRPLAGATTIRLAQESEIVRLYPDCEAGAMPPFGPLYGHRVFVDSSLAADPEVVFNAGTHTDAIRVRYQDLVKVVGPVVGDFGRAPGRAWT